MSTLFGRVVALDFGAPSAEVDRLTVEANTGAVAGRRFSGLRVGFRARKVSAGRPDPCEVRVWNMSEASIGVLERPDAVARVLAGYGRLVQIAAGTVVRHSLSVAMEGPDRVAAFQIHDGGLELRRSYFARAWAGRVRAEDVIEEVLTVTGWARGTIEPAKAVTYARGFVGFGAVDAVLDTVAADTGSTWTVQHGRLHLWPSGTARRASSLVISPTSGLVAEPKAGDNGSLTVTSLLQPGLAPGDRFVLRSRRYDGTYVATAVEHVGDTHGAEFYTSVTARPE